MELYPCVHFLILSERLERKLRDSTSKNAVRSKIEINDQILEQ
jgi:hypothetical protein